MKNTIRVQLSVMMFLQFFIWGSWYVTMGTYLAKSLGADGVQIGVAYFMMAIATIISPFFIGIVADRFFAAEKLLSFLHLAGGIVLLFITRISDVTVFNLVLLLYTLLYTPTMALSNSLAFSQLQGTGKSFSGIRVFGTIGWIIAGVLIDKVFKLPDDAKGFTFTMAGIASIALAALSLTLPHTPPKAKQSKNSAGEIIGANAFVLFKSRSFTVFFISSILICIPLSFYYALANQFLTEVGMKDATSNMTFGQVSEAVCILLIPFCMRRWGIKWMIMVGMIAWVLRFIFFRYGDAGSGIWMLFAGILLHGVCFDFFFVTGQMYTDRMADEKFRSAAQGMITMATYGIGMAIGTLFSGYIAKQQTIGPNAHHWDTIWIIPAAIAFVVLILFSVFFKNEDKVKLSPA